MSDIPKFEDTEEIKFEDTTEINDAPMEDVEQDPGKLESFGKGIIEGIPFATEIAAAAETVYESGLDDFSDNFDRNQEEWEESINIAEEKNPISFTAGDIVGGVGTAIALTAATGGIGAGVGGAAALGAASSVSREDEDLTPSNVLSNAASGAALGVVGYGIGKGIAKGLGAVSRSLGFVASKSVVEAGGAQTSKNIATANEHIRKHYLNNTTKTVNQAAKEFGDDLKSLGILKWGATPEKVNKAAGSHGRKISAQISGLLDDMNVKGSVDGEDIFNEFLKKPLKGEGSASLMEILDNPKATTQMKEAAMATKKKLLANLQGTPKMVKAGTIKDFQPTGILDAKGSPILKEIITDNMVEKPQWHKYTAKELNSLRRELGSTLGRGANKSTPLMEKASLSDDMDTKLVSYLSDKVSTVVGESSDDVSKESFRAMNRQLANSMVVQDMTQDLMKHKMGGALSILKESIQTRGMIVGGISGAAGASRQAALGITLGINRMISSTTTGSNLAVGLNKITRHLTTNPESPLVKKIFVASALSTEAFRGVLKASIAELNLSEVAVGRTVDDLYARKDDILAALQDHNPEQAAALRELYETNDEIALAGFADTMSKDPIMRRYFESGSGFDGRVFSAEDKAFYTNEIQSSKASLVQKIGLLNDLKRTGTIPIIEDDTQPRKKFQPRNKNKQRI
jgi:hypothetical protein